MATNAIEMPITPRFFAHMCNEVKLWGQEKKSKIEGCVFSGEPKFWEVAWFSKIQKLTFFKKIQKTISIGNLVGFLKY